MAQQDLLRSRLLALVAAMMLLSACSVRSISDSGYPGDRGQANPFYKGELSELEILGIDSNAPITEQQIAQALADQTRIVARKGGALMLVQSGAAIPDEPMVSELSRYYAVIPFSGVPAPRAQDAGQNRPDYAKVLRLAAARAGSDVILVYWGVLEAARQGEVTKAVSWVPILGSIIPDETQNMRIRLKAAVVDVRSGRWAMFSSEDYQDSAVSTSLGRRASDQAQVAQLKDQAYRSLATAFVNRFAQ